MERIISEAVSSDRRTIAFQVPMMRGATLDEVRSAVSESALRAYDMVERRRLGIASNFKPVEMSYAFSQLQGAHEDAPSSAGHPTSWHSSPCHSVTGLPGTTSQPAPKE